MPQTHKNNSINSSVQVAPYSTARPRSFVSPKVKSFETSGLKLGLNQCEETTTTKTTTKSSDNGARWSVTHANSVPIWQLERGTVYIKDEPRIVSTRIDTSLRLRSVEAQFNSEHAEVTCTTCDFIRYKVTLYTGPNGNGTYVEVMRLEGCPFAFRIERNATIDAAKGISNEVSTKATKGNERKMQIPSIPKMTIPDNLRKLYIPPTQSELESTLDSTSDRFHSNNRHEVLFALQHLVSITNGNKAHSESAAKLSKLIIQNKSHVRDMIVSIYANELLHNMRNDDETSQQICNASLSILSNGLITLSKDDGFLDRDECQSFIESLLPYLVKGVEQCKCTHLACLALGCLSQLLHKSSVACMKARDSSNMSQVIAEAERYGKREHCKLEEVAKSTIEIIQSKLVVL